MSPLEGVGEKRRFEPRGRLSPAKNDLAVAKIDFRQFLGVRNVSSERREVFTLLKFFDILGKVGDN